jgi:regulator of nucleoside diphosphate kinase
LETGSSIVNLRLASTTARPKLERRETTDMRQRTILITDSDMNRLRHLLESALNFFRRDRPYLETLKQELNDARVVTTEQMPQDVVVLNSRIRIVDLNTGKQAAYKLVFPRDSHVGNDRLSVLAPIGTAILGRRAGEVVECSTPAGLRKLKLEEVERIPKEPMALEGAA